MKFPPNKPDINSKDLEVIDLLITSKDYNDFEWRVLSMEPPPLDWPDKILIQQPDWTK